MTQYGGLTGSTSDWFQELTSLSVHLSSSLQQSSSCVHLPVRGLPCRPSGLPSPHCGFALTMTGSDWMGWKWTGALCCCTPTRQKQTCHLLQPMCIPPYIKRNWNTAVSRARCTLLKRWATEENCLSSRDDSSSLVSSSSEPRWQ